MRLLLKTLGYSIMVLSASFAASDLAKLVATAGENSLQALARLYALAMVGVGGYLLWRAGDGRRQPAPRNPAWHLAALLAGVLLALFAGLLSGLALASVLSNVGQPEADPSTWGLLVFFGGAILGGAMLALGEYGRFSRAQQQVAVRHAATPGHASPPASRWERVWGWLRLAASLTLGLAMLQQGMDLLGRAQTANGMDIGAKSAGVLAWLILPIDALIFLTAALTLAWLLRPGQISGVLAGSSSFVVDVVGIVLALVATAAVSVTSVLLLPATLLFFVAYPASLLVYARHSSRSVTTTDA